MAQPQGPNKRTMIVLCVILGLLAVVAVFRFASLGSGGDDGSTAAPPATDVTAPPAAPATTTTTVPPGEPVVPTGEFDVFSTRDPFEPVVQLATASTSADAGPAPATGASTPAAPPAATPASSGTRVVLVEVLEVDGVVQAQIQVNGEVHTVAPGQTFATSFKVVSISGTCGQFLYGDAPFSLCKGEEVVK